MEKDPDRRNRILLKVLPVLCRCYSSGEFEPLFPLLSEDAELHSMWVLTPLKGKEALVDYYRGKGKTLKKSGCLPECSIVQLEGGMKLSPRGDVIVNGERKTGSVGLLYEDGKYCMFMNQVLNGRNNEGIADVDIDDNGLICRISLCDPVFFRFRQTGF